jgi:signal peptidase I
MNGDHILVDVWRYRHSKALPGQIIVFRRPESVFLKRLIAGEGHTIYGKNGDVFLDDALLEEPYAHHSLSERLHARLQEMNNFGPIQIPPGKLFVMGDNRDLSFDSRAPGFGLIDEESVFGEPLYVPKSKSPQREGRTFGNCGRDDRTTLWVDDNAELWSGLRGNDGSLSACGCIACRRS